MRREMDSLDKVKKFEANPVNPKRQFNFWRELKTKEAES